MGYRVVVVGATGNVGREMMNVLAERAFPCDEVAAVASPRSQGTEVEFGDTGKILKCQNIENFDFTGWAIALFSAGSGSCRSGRGSTSLRPRGGATPRPRPRRRKSPRWSSSRRRPSFARPPSCRR